MPNTHIAAEARPVKRPEIKWLKYWIRWGGRRKEKRVSFHSFLAGASPAFYSHSAVWEHHGSRTRVLRAARAPKAQLHPRSKVLECAQTNGAFSLLAPKQHGANGGLYPKSSSVKLNLHLYFRVACKITCGVKLHPQPFD